jgi:hypothetical protein
MKNQIKAKPKKKYNKFFNILFYLSLLIIPAFIAVFSNNYFNDKYSDVNNKLSDSLGNVAGTFDDKTKDITSDIPMLPSSEISNFDTSNGTVNMTLTFKIPEDQVKSFYQDYFFINGWKQIDTNKYEKDNKTILIEISPEFVKMTIKENTKINN